MQVQDSNQLIDALNSATLVDCLVSKGVLDLGQKKIKLRIKFKDFKIKREMTRFCVIFSLILILYSFTTLTLTNTLFSNMSADQLSHKWANVSGILVMGFSFLAIFLIRIVEFRGSFACCISYLLFTFLNWKIALISARQQAEWIFLMYSCVPTMFLMLIAFVFGSKGFLLAANAVEPVEIMEKKENKAH
jgi:hypothetical protein